MTFFDSLTLEDEGATFVQNAGNYSYLNTMSHRRKLNLNRFLCLYLFLSSLGLKSMDPLNHIISIVGLQQQFRAAEGVQAQDVFLLRVVISNINLTASHVHRAARRLRLTDSVTHIQRRLQQQQQQHAL